jgi:hypothetical protein
MVTDELWRHAGPCRDCLCIACLEDRIDRALEPKDFPPLPLNDDEPTDTVRLRLWKGSGRATLALYGIAQHAVLSLGADLSDTAALLGLDASLLAIWVDGARMVETRPDRRAVERRQDRNDDQSHSHEQESI